MEVATESAIFHSNGISDKEAIAIEDVNYPTCILEKDNNILPLSRDDFIKYLLMHSTILKLVRQNRHINYKFRDTDCM